MPNVTINIRPQPKPQTAKALRYDKRYKKYKRDLQWLFAEQGLKNLPDTFHINFVFAAPKSDPNRRGPHTQKPDLDNLVKAVLDSLAGKGGDDSHVHSLSACKAWGSSDQITISY